MRLKLYDSIASYQSDTFSVFLEDEVRNNLQIGIITGSKELYKTNWLLCAVFDDDGAVVLTAMCTPPFNLLLYESLRGGARYGSGENAVKMLAYELIKRKHKIRGVFAERELARRFAAEYAPGGAYRLHMSLSAMRLDKPENITKAPGVFRELRESDLKFAPHWEREFFLECRVEASSVKENEKRIRERLGREVQFFWQNGEIPVSQALHGRSTLNGAVINNVYTPPRHRGRGYATSVVAQLTEMLLCRNGVKFCCLFADESNRTSRAIYEKIGYYDVCTFDEITF